MQIYNVYQSGKRLYIDEKENPDNKIVVNKYDNMQQTLRLISDGTLPPRLYWALRNPKLSQKYFILPLINNEDLIVGTDISATPGLWDMLLIGTDEDYIIEGTDIDQSKLTYISDHFGRLFVRDNFLEELDFEEQCSPTFRVFYDEIIFQLGEKADTKDIPDKMSDLENDTNFISGVTFKDDGEGHVEIIGTTFGGGETEEGEIPSGSSIEVDDKLDEESTNPVQNKVVTKEIKTLKDKDESLDKEILTLREENEALEQKNAELESSIEKLQIKQTTDKAPFHHITDSANMKVVDFGMEGKTTQDGTPTPENQVEIVNAGVLNEDTGRYEHKFTVGNKNWLSMDMLIDGVVLDAKGNTSYRDGYCATEAIQLPVGMWAFSCQNTDNTVVLVTFDSNGKRTSTPVNGKISQKTFTISDDTAYVRFGVHKSKEVAESMNIQLEYNGTQTEYTPSKRKQFTLTSPVPLTKWDYLSKRDGVWGWSIWSYTGALDSLTWNIMASSDSVRSIFRTNTTNKAVGPGTVRCSHLRNYTDSHIWLSVDLLKATSGTNGTKTIYCNVSPEFTTPDEFKTWLVENNVIFQYQTFEEQSFHPLPDEEQELLNNLETYYGVTNLYNDQGCPTWLCYTCDSKLYVDQKLEQINNALLSLGANV